MGNPIEIFHISCLHGQRLGQCLSDDLKMSEKPPWMAKWGLQIFIFTEDTFYKVANKDPLQNQTGASQLCSAASSAVKCALLLWASMWEQLSNALVISKTAVLIEATSNSLTMRGKKKSLWGKRLYNSSLLLKHAWNWRIRIHEDFTVEQKRELPICCCEHCFRCCPGKHSCLPFQGPVWCCTCNEQPYLDRRGMSGGQAGSCHTEVQQPLSDKDTSQENRRLRAGYPASYIHTLPMRKDISEAASAQALFFYLSWNKNIYEKKSRKSNSLLPDAQQDHNFPIRFIWVRNSFYWLLTSVIIQEQGKH